MTAILKVENGMRREDIRAFKQCAQACEVYLLVRLTNNASLQFIGMEGFSPKPLSCKAKTADQDVRLFLSDKQTMHSLCAGLVVDPTLPGMRAAFFTEKKFLETCKKWNNEFRYGVAPPDIAERRRRKYTQIHSQKRYAVQLDPDSRHYGCVMYTTGAFPVPLQRKTVKYKKGVCLLDACFERYYDPYLANGCSYLHGDYDLYGIVDANEPAKLQLMWGRLSEGEHTFGLRWWKVQHMLNDILLDSPMIQHGSQETYSGHEDVQVALFYPDGRRVALMPDEAAITRLYRDEFGSRPTVKEMPGLVLDAQGRST